MIRVARLGSELSKTQREGSRLQRTLLVCANRRLRNTYTYS